MVNPWFFCDRCPRFLLSGTRPEACGSSVELLGVFLGIWLVVWNIFYFPIYIYMIIYDYICVYLE